jgi:hypothetical protein
MGETGERIRIALPDVGVMRCPVKELDTFLEIVLVGRRPRPSSADL